MKQDKVVRDIKQGIARGKDVTITVKPGQFAKVVGARRKGLSVFAQTEDGGELSVNPEHKVWIL